MKIKNDYKKSLFSRKIDIKTKVEISGLEKTETELTLIFDTRQVTKYFFVYCECLRRTWKSLAKFFDGCGHLLLTNPLILLSFGGCLETLPG